MEHTWPQPFSADVVRPVYGTVSAYTLALEAWRRGLTVTAVNGGIQHFWVEDGSGNAIKFIGARPSMTTSRAVRIAGDKHQTNTLLHKAGLTAPKSRLINAREFTREQVATHVSGMDLPLVIKPLKGTKGRGVFTGITSVAEFMEYYSYLVDELDCRDVVIESQATGEDVRVLVIGDQVAGAILRIPANIEGDGKHTIDELITRKNELRAQNPFLHSGPIKKDNEVLNYIQQSGFSLETVLNEGSYLRLRGKSNGSAGGDSIDITDDLPEEVKDHCVRAVHAIPGLFCAGVDILYDRGPDNVVGSYSIIELNATPQIGLNMYPMLGHGQDVPKIWVDVCFPGSQRSGIPGEESLTFSLEEPLQALRSGAASHVTIAAAPRQRLPYRRCYRLTSGTELNQGRKLRLIRQARRRGISGALTPSATSEYSLFVAAEDSAILDRFVSWVVKEFRATLSSEFEEWNEVVRLGFHVGEI